MIEPFFLQNGKSNKDGSTFVTFCLKVVNFLFLGNRIVSLQIQESVYIFLYYFIMTNMKLGIYMGHV